MSHVHTTSHAKIDSVGTCAALNRQCHGSALHQRHRLDLLDLNVVDPLAVPHGFDLPNRVGRGHVWGVRGETESFVDTH